VRAALMLDDGAGCLGRRRYDPHDTLDHTTIAVEVTRHNVPSSVAILSELDKRDRHFPELRYDWVVDMVQAYNGLEGA
jgi:hypothetical protein